MRIMVNPGVKAAAALISVVSNTLLIVTKGAVGLFTGSVSVLAEAIHSAVDLAAALVAYVAVRVADQPPDEAHAFGHGKFENISGTVEALLILAAAAYIGYEAIARILHGAGVEHLGIGMGVMLLSALANWFVSARLFKVARETDSIALEADGQHLRLDVYTSIGVLAGLLAVQLTGVVLIDRILGLGVALWIAWIGFGLSRTALGPLLDLQLPPDEVERIVALIGSDTRVLGYHKLRTRKSGGQRHVDVHLIVPKAMSLTEAHNLAEEVEDRIRAELDNVTILTHVEPEGE
ncbi:MAG TPA: cation diffusion facilitator family transporter [Armatimonadota bacterium]|nr:cation diffusion facilitator family transporter [Armatimonadota bacterium]